MKSLELMRLQMKVSEVWMQATGEQFVDVCADPHVQLDRISRELSHLTALVAAMTHDAINADNEKLRLEAAIEAYSDMEMDYMSLRSKVILSPDGLK